MKIFFLFGLLLATCISCKVLSPGVSLTFKNDTGKDIRSFEANVVREQLSFSNIRNGESSPKVVVSSAYEYCYAKVVTLENDTLICQPIDFVGETKHTSGKLEIKLRIETSNGQRWLSMRR